MSRHIPSNSISRRSRTLAAVAVATFSGVLSSTASAQSALGTPFIGGNLLSFHTAPTTRSGGPEMTRTFGILYGHRFASSDATSHINFVLRASARPLEQVDSGVLDVAATAGLSQQVDGIPNLTFAASTGVGMMAWSDDAAKTGRVQLSIPANAGISYDLHVGGATISPFAMGTAARYDLRTSLNDERVSKEKGWDSYYTTGASLRLREVVLSSSRIVGEHGMPRRSRWAFSAGISF